MKRFADHVCDSHVHVFDPARFPYVTPRKFTPGVANVDALKMHLADCGASRAVIVQPSVYGTDNACLLDALKQLSGTARGVAVVDKHTTDETLAALHAAGVRGARLNMVVEGSTDASAANQAVRELDAQIPSSWHIQLHVVPQVLLQLRSGIEKTDRDFVVDHFGLVKPGVDMEVLRAQFLDVLNTGRLNVKLSAPYLLSTATQYEDLRYFAEALLASRPDRVLWGTNWPHTQGTARSLSGDPNAIEPFRQHDDLVWRDLCLDWAGADAGQVMAFNAAELYEFPLQIFNAASLAEFPTCAQTT